MEEVYVLCSECEEAYRCHNAMVNDGCDLGIQTPSKDELSDTHLLIQGDS